jgi:hypothetical protein
MNAAEIGQPRRISNMKTSLVLFIAAHFIGGIVAGDAVEECGHLGVMSLEGADLAGVDVTEIRKCAGHPNERIRDMAPPGRSRSSLLASDQLRCTNGDPYGCQKGYCWTICGNNRKWCWIAEKNRWGPWIKCRKMRDCPREQIDRQCGRACDKCYCGC